MRVPAKQMQPPYQPIHGRVARAGAGDNVERRQVGNACRVGRQKPPARIVKPAVGMAGQCKAKPCARGTQDQIMP